MQTELRVTSIIRTSQIVGGAIRENGSKSSITTASMSTKNDRLSASVETFLRRLPATFHQIAETLQLRGTQEAINLLREIEDKNQKTFFSITDINNS